MSRRVVGWAMVVAALVGAILIGQLFAEVAGVHVAPFRPAVTPSPYGPPPNAGR